MDCDLARLLLALARPGELPASDADALARHLQTCAGCAAKASAATRFDGVVRTAICDVPTPVEGKLGALRAVRVAEAKRRRRRFARAGSLVAAALVVAGLATGTAARLRIDADGNRIVADAGLAVENPEGEVRAYLADQGVPPPPFDFDYAHHLNHGRLSILGTDAPAVTFAVAGPGGRIETATAYALSRNRFHLADLRFAQASFYNVTVLDGPDGSGVRWAVVHTTPSLAPFALKPVPPV